MNVHARIADRVVADSWSCDYPFEEVEIEVDGICVGSFSGTAELANDPGYTYYVKAITLDGTHRGLTGRGPYGRWPVSKKVHLDRPAARPETLSEHLFTALAESLDCQDALDHFLAEKESA